MSWLWNNYISGGSTVKYRWISALIVFSDGGEIVLDKGYLFLGDLPIYYLGYYCNFTNFSVIEGKLYYFYKNGVVKQIDPAKVHLHIKFGQSPFEISLENINYWNLFFSSVKNKIYISISNDLNEKNITMIDISGKFSSKNRLKNINLTHPLFKRNRYMV